MQASASVVATHDPKQEQRRRENRSPIHEQLVMLHSDACAMSLQLRVHRFQLVDR
jgi:hypothetical protein